MKISIAVITVCLSMFLVACNNSITPKNQVTAQPVSPEEIQRRADNKTANQKRRADNKTKNQIWKAYATHPGNSGQGVKWINVKGEIIRQGTVPPSAVNSSAKGRLPAYLACYDFVSVMSGIGDIEGNLCLYYIDNPSRGTHAIMWRGKKYMSDIESSMASDGFTS